MNKIIEIIYDILLITIPFEIFIFLIIVFLENEFEFAMEQFGTICAAIIIFQSLIVLLLRVLLCIIDKISRHIK